HIAHIVIWCWMLIHNAISTSCREHAAVQCREACLVSWIEQLPPWARANYVALSLSLCLILANLKLAYKVWKSCMKVQLCVAVLLCVYRVWVILNELQVACARELQCLVKC